MNNRIFQVVLTLAVSSGWFTSPRAGAFEVVLAEAVAEAVALEAGDINQQLRAHFEPLVKVELSFAIRVCKLEGDQRKELIVAAEKWLVQFVKDSEKRQPNPRRGVRIIRGGAARGDTRDPRGSVAKGIAAVVKSVLTPEQVALYEQECQQREEFQRKAIAAMLVARMDEKLTLSAEQRGNLAESFVEKWNAQWAPQPELFMYNQDIWPSIPDKIVSPHLTPAQWEIWTRLRKGTQRIHFDGVFPNQEQVIDDVELEQPVADPAAPPVDAVLEVAPAR